MWMGTSRSKRLHPLFLHHKSITLLMSPLCLGVKRGTTLCCVDSHSPSHFQIGTGKTVNVCFSLKHLLGETQGLSCNRDHRERCLIPSSQAPSGTLNVSETSEALRRGDNPVLSWNHQVSWFTWVVKHLIGS